MLRERRNCTLGDSVPKALESGRDIWTFTDQDVDSRILAMNMTGVDVDKVMRRMDEVAALSAKVSAVLGHTK